MRITDDGAIRLANAIIFQAIHDYRTGNKAEQLDALRFFNSEWCNVLLHKGLTGKDILRKIEKN